jgi:adenosine deaminase
MGANTASIHSLLSAFLLSDYRVQILSWCTPFAEPLEWVELREPVYLAYQPWAARFPDHVFDSAWSFLAASQQPNQGVLLTAIKSLVDEFLELRHENIRVHLNLLGAWQQGLVSRLSSLPIQAGAHVFFGSRRRRSQSASHEDDGNVLHNFDILQRKVMPLLIPYVAPVADYIEREGLHEAHLHLNGSTHAEICWLRAICDPKKEILEFSWAWKNYPSQASIIHELVKLVNPDLTPYELYRHIRTAARIRAWLISFAENRIAPEVSYPMSCQFLCDASNDEWAKGIGQHGFLSQTVPDIQSERIWMSKLVAKLILKPSVQLTRMFHAYLLLLNEYYQLLVQGESRFGFDQFQKYTLTGLRDQAEADYQLRFHAMHGPRRGTSIIGYLEGRFAPKDEESKSLKLFEAILGGYLIYLYDVTKPNFRLISPRLPRSLTKILDELERFFEISPASHRSVLRLTLVAHFIKQQWSPTQSNAGPYRHHSLDKKLQTTTAVLLSLLSKYPKLKRWVRGIDAASNELHAPPDVFASAFRVCERAGLSRRTFHAGEDFRHLLSGIAAIWDALTLLDLRNGDRIGHATAMGIRPSLWIDRMPNKITITQGEWMLGVLAAWQLLRNVAEAQLCANKLQRELETTAFHIFDKPLTGAEVERAMALRGLSRRDLMRQHEKNAGLQYEPLCEFWREEMLMVQLLRQNQPESVALVWQWLSNTDVQTRAEKLINKDAGFLNPSEYLILQQALMREVSDRGVLIETLPSSNVRISQYQHVDEHHSLRWMRVPDHIEVGDPEIMVCLGSDDPGIFATNLEIEFYLLYGAIRQSGLNDSEALTHLRILNERGKIYRFHHPSLF